MSEIKNTIKDKELFQKAEQQTQQNKGKAQWTCRAIEIIKIKTQRQEEGGKPQSIYKLTENSKWSNITTTGIPAGEKIENRVEEIFKELTGKQSPKIMKDITS